VDTHVHADHVTGLGTLRQLAYPKKIDVALPANLHCGVPQGIHATPDALTTPPKSAP
jgi:ribonuclease BN (tRNA processing enzyme)